MAAEPAGPEEDLSRDGRLSGSPRDAEGSPAERLVAEQPHVARERREDEKTALPTVD
jgi:hypothetical protein